MGLMELDDDKGFISSFIDYREDHPLKLIRILNIVERLSLNRNGKKVLTIENAAFINYLYENPSIIPHVLDYFNKDYSWISVNPTLYDIALDTADLYRSSDFKRSIIELVGKGLISLDEIDGDYYISIQSESSFRIEDDLQKKWSILSLKLRFLLSKPISTLYKSLPGYIK